MHQATSVTKNCFQEAKTCSKIAGINRIITRITDIDQSSGSSNHIPSNMQSNRSSDSGEPGNSEKSLKERRKSGVGGAINGEQSLVTGMSGCGEQWQSLIGCLGD